MGCFLDGLLYAFVVRLRSSAHFFAETAPFAVRESGEIFRERLETGTLRIS